jgi:DNA uptake protein ComE-like DNA-binding protein
MERFGTSSVLNSNSVGADTFGRTITLNLVIVLLLSSRLMLALVPQEKPLGADLSAELPTGRGKALVLQRCTQCHGLQIINSQRKTAAEWRQEIQAMVTLGANLADVEMRIMAAYLAKVFGPEIPPQVHLNKADETMFERLPGIDNKVAHSIWSYRHFHGPFSSKRELLNVPDISAELYDRVAAYMVVDEPVAEKEAPGSKQ